MQTKILLLRHGKTQANVEKRYIGTTDEPLLLSERQRLSEISQELCLPKQPPYLFASPMKRCLATGAALFPDGQPIVIPEFREMDFGDFEMKNYMELKDDARYQAWIDSNGTLPFPHGESREAFITRSVKGFARVLHTMTNGKFGQTFRLCEQTDVCIRQMLRAGKITAAYHRLSDEAEERQETQGKDTAAMGVCVVHGGTIMALLSFFAGGDYFDYACENGSGYVLEIEWQDG